MKGRLTVAAAALSLLALGSVYAGVASACEGYSNKYTSAEPQTSAEARLRASSRRRACRAPSRRARLSPRSPLLRSSRAR